MTKADLADKVSKGLSCTKNEAFDLVELTLETLKEAIRTCVRSLAPRHLIDGTEGRGYDL